MQIRAIQELQRDASLLASEGHKKMQANDFSCVSIFREVHTYTHACEHAQCGAQPICNMLRSSHLCILFTQALQKIDTALVKIEEMAGQDSSLSEIIVATQVETVKLQAQLNDRLQQAICAKTSFEELRKVDQTEREKNPTGVIDLRGRERKIPFWLTGRSPWATHL